MITTELEKIDLNSGWRAKLYLKFVEENKKTVLKQRKHEGPLQVQKLFYPELDGTCHVYILHPPGGVVGGEVFFLQRVANDFDFRFPLTRHCTQNGFFLFPLLGIFVDRP